MHGPWGSGSGCPNPLLAQKEKRRPRMEESLAQEQSGTPTSQIRIPPVLVLPWPIWVDGAPPAPIPHPLQLPAMCYPQLQGENNVLEVKMERTTKKY